VPADRTDPLPAIQAATRELVDAVHRLPEVTFGASGTRQEVNDRYVTLYKLTAADDLPRPPALTWLDWPGWGVAMQLWIAEVEAAAKRLVLQYVTLDQMAAVVSRSKKTFERLKQQAQLPLPDVEGGGGKPDEWVWSRVRPWLESKFGKKLPERFPSRLAANGH
jgi:hypothetical protein